MMNWPVCSMHKIKGFALQCSFSSFSKQGQGRRKKYYYCSISTMNQKVWIYGPIDAKQQWIIINRFSVLGTCVTLHTPIQESKHIIYYFFKTCFITARKYRCQKEISLDFWRTILFLLYHERRRRRKRWNFFSEKTILELKKKKKK